MGRERERSRRSRSRSRGDRRRSRSRSRDKSRRSRSRERGAGGGGMQAPTSFAPGGYIPPAGANMQALVAMQAQQQEMQRQQMLQSLLLQQQALASIPGVTIGNLGAAAGSSAAPSAATKKAREIYVGNLAVGVMTVDLVRELFNSAMANFVPDPVTNPPIVEVKMDSTGRFCFLEMRTLELAAHLMELDKMEVCGRPLKIGRPKGYEEEALKYQSQQKLNMAQTFAAQLSGGPTNVVLLENLVPAKNVLDPAERREIYDDVFAEATKCGPVAGVAVPVPSTDLPDDEPCRVYAKYHHVEDAKKCKEMMDGRTFDERVVKASYSNEFDFMRAQQGEWILAAPAIQQVSIPVMAAPSAPAVTIAPGLSIGGVSIPGLSLPPGVVIPGLSMLGM